MRSPYGTADSPKPFCDYSEPTFTSVAQQNVSSIVQPTRQTTKADSKDRLPYVFNAEELLSGDFPEPRPIIEHLLYPGVTLLIGRPKVGKSWMSLQVALAMISGAELCRHFRVRQPGRVLYLALEESQSRTKSRIRRLAPISPDNIRDLRFVYAVDSLQTGGALQIDGLLASHPRWFHISKSDFSES